MAIIYIPLSLAVVGRGLNLAEPFDVSDPFLALALRIRATPKRYPRRIQPVSRNHHQVEKLVSSPASQPADPPAVDVITHRCLFAKANEFGFDVHSSHIHPSLGLRSQPANCLCSEGQSIGGTAREVKSVTMAENVVPFPVGPEPERSRPTCTKRVMLTIGTKRYALEFSSTVMEVNPADAQVIPIQHRKPSRRPKSSKNQGDSVTAGYRNCEVGLDLEQAVSER